MDNFLLLVIKLNISFIEIKLIILFELIKEVTSMTILKKNSRR